MRLNHSVQKRYHSIKKNKKKNVYTKKFKHRRLTEPAGILYFYKPLTKWLYDHLSTHPNRKAMKRRAKGAHAHAPIEI